MNQLFGLFSSGVSNTSESARPNAFYTISGQATFKVDVQTEGSIPLTNSSFSVHAVQRSNPTLAIGSRCEWFRSYFSKNIPVRGSGSTYRVSALDIGAKIIAKITSMEPDEKGEVLVTFGPIRMGDNQKQVLKNVIRSGGAKFEFESISPYDADEGLHAGSAVVFQNNIKFSMMNATGKELRLFFGEHFEMTIGNKDDRTVCFKFFETIKLKELKEYFELKTAMPHDRLVIKLGSQTSRDNFIIAIRAFEEMIELKDKIILDKTLEMMPIVESGEMKRLTVSNDDISTQLDSRSMEKELKLLNQTNQSSSMEKDKLAKIVDNLDNEVSKTQHCKLISHL